MAYKKHTWVAREGVNLNKFAKTGETAAEVILTNDPDSITVAGTPFTAGWMNEIEDGLAFGGGNIEEVDSVNTIDLSEYDANLLVIADTSGGAFTQTFSNALPNGRKLIILCDGGNDLTISYTASGGSHSFIMKDTEEVQLLSNGSSLLAVKGVIRLWRGSTNANVNLTTIFGNSGIAYRTGVWRIAMSLTTVTSYTVAFQYPDTIYSHIDVAARVSIARVYSTYIDMQGTYLLKEVDIFL